MRKIIALTYLAILFISVAIVTSLSVGQNTGEHRKISIKGSEGLKNEGIKKGQCKNSNKKEFFYLVKKTKPGLLKKKQITVVVTCYYKPERYEENYYQKLRMNGRGLETSSGTVPKKGTIAADPRFFPEGTRLFIPGYGIATVEDTGQLIKGNKIDLFMGNGAQAYNKSMDFGKQKMKVFILPPDV